MNVDPNMLPFWKFVCVWWISETFLEFHHFEHLLHALMKPNGFQLHFLAPAYHPQYNLSYCVSYNLARSPGFTSSFRWHNKVTAMVGFDTVPPINFRILICFTSDIIATIKHTESRHASSGQIHFQSHDVKWPAVELVALDHNRISYWWKLLMLASYKMALLANTW